MTQLTNVSDYPTDNQDQPGLIKTKPRHHILLPSELRAQTPAEFNPSQPSTPTPTLEKTPS